MESSKQQQYQVTHQPAAADRGMVVGTRWILMLTVAISLFLGLFRLDAYPAMWFDEGSYLEVARNIAEGRGYASYSAEGEPDYAPAISMGPSAMLPFAGVVWLNGNTVVGVRSLAVVFMVVATFLYFKTARYVFGTSAAVVGLIVLFTMPAIQWVFHGRHVVGEMPAVMFLLLGGVLVFRARKRHYVFLAGTVLGLAIVTKPLFAVLLPAVIVLVAGIDLAAHKIRDAHWYAMVILGASIPAIVWLVSLAWIMGFENVPAQISILTNTSTQSVATADPRLLPENLRHIFGPPAYFLVGPAFLAGLLAYHRAAGDRKLIILSMLILQAIWIPWFIFVSAGWTRYVFPALTISTMFFGVLAVYALEAYRSLLRRRLPVPAWSIKASFSAALLLSLALVGLGADRTLKPVVIYGGTDAADFAAAMDSVIPTDATVAGWQPELNYLSSRQLHYPPVGTLAAALEKARMNLEGAPKDVPPPPATDYIVIGDVSRFVGIYHWHVFGGEYDLILTIGQYELYERKDDS